MPSRDTWDNQVIRCSQHGLMKGRSHLTNLISFYHKITYFGNEGKAVEVAYLDFSKVFNLYGATSSIQFNEHSNLLSPPAQ